MNKTTRVPLLAAGVVLATVLAEILAFMLGNKVSGGAMKRIEVNGRVISIESAHTDYKFDMPTHKSEPVDGVLVMLDGTEYDISYDSDFDVFTINDKFGYYTLHW